MFSTLSREIFFTVYNWANAETRDAVGVHKDHAALMCMLACSHGNVVVVLFVLHNRELMQPWPRYQSVTSSSWPIFHRGMFGAPYHPPPTSIPEPDASLTDKTITFHDDDLFAGSCTLVVSLRRFISCVRAKFIRGISISRRWCHPRISELSTEKTRPLYERYFAIYLSKSVLVWRKDPYIRKRMM